jgi:hypothetical protein
MVGSKALAETAKRFVAAAESLHANRPDAVAVFSKALLEAGSNVRERFFEALALEVKRCPTTTLTK